MTGGLNGEEVLDTTEVLKYGGRWREAGRLPAPKSQQKGATIGGVFHVAGGGDSSSKTSDIILSWDPVSESWSVAGHMKMARNYHAVTAAPLSLLSYFCPFAQLSSEGTKAATSGVITIPMLLTLHWLLD